MSDWLIVANSSEARIYEIRSRKNIHLIKFLEHPESRMKTRDLITDKPAHYRSNLKAPGSSTDRANPKATEMARFAKRIVDIVEHASVLGQFNNIFIVAPAQFHGLLDRLMSDGSIAKIKMVIHKDYTDLGTEELRNVVYPLYEPISI